MGVGSSEGFQNGSDQSKTVNRAEMQAQKSGRSNTMRSIR